MEETLSIDKSQVVTFVGKKIAIDCLEGILWITWPNGVDTLLRENQGITIQQNGKIGVTAMSQAKLKVKKIDNGFLGSLINFFPAMTSRTEPARPLLPITNRSLFPASAGRLKNQS